MPPTISPAPTRRPVRARQTGMPSQPKWSMAIEVRTGQARGNPGTLAFTQAHRGARSLTVGAGGIPIEDFLSVHPREWLG